ncbi:hypothetical protein [Streptomyces sp. NBC_01014]|uniref:hypothetical protein n=1 Tax=Streptomyces sp. NBC_01014 TaxID=2903719 RepID=UPI003865A2C2|nr:hypothetical protein OG282_31335 [Streptomyces sp. NBC_01014]
MTVAPHFGATPAAPPSRTVPSSWPGTERSRTETAKLLSRPPFTLENAGSELHHKHGIVMVRKTSPDRPGRNGG